ncbi:MULTISPECIES: anaerobic glycerol-3-phosphate dehydrogenase subunit GlpC [Butyricimonas]|jgi:glycerol-3-phosphate dehydrogenase subunit C|uniref:Glycerol-3-phosphate dehydrogenase subunit C n=1 Tax=Butyricimonas faecihominis TaxID=1472416 RepID=A0A7W6N0P8_9BACT|nr:MULTISPECIES: anaerobic glycerol-3-phosphate dehydrogenase subunit GlpC [Butyricimonas]MBS6689740.1 anaerobic glycerol-3-phosphate dehydrogenase subunit C [Sanguibacteroides justesenii]OKZ18034.1 MAG: sn-glycerol-3-phosphate dehydrogenase subunit C [Butyricimonas synergistica]KAB1496329.1 anaerobic glycerol-3-phosphate dehydrogenase subunit C [Butyricimonas faecihominis]MBB4028236.1 glycerol-3-phosphate dehydrogenase subunit C [Butyricimonas faecihominis]WOF08940.1 anaerobic glycerol-3-phos
MNLQQHNISDNNFEQCIKCTICTVYCPVAAVNPNYPGPKQAGPDGERLRLKKFNFYDESLKYCINCKRCEVACPSNVKIGDIIQAARIKYSKKQPKLRDYILANTDLVGTLSTPFAPIVNTTLGLKPVKAILDGVMKIDHRRTFPKYAFGTFESWYKKVAEKQAAYPSQVSYFHGCYVNYNNPQLGKDLIKVMNAFSIGVQLLEKEKCCGVALISNGLIKQAQKQARTNINSIRKSVLEKKMPVIATSSTCTFTIRDEYPHLLDIDNADVREDVELATRYIYRLLSQKKTKLNFKTGQKIKVAYHTPCHMEKLGWAYYSIELLKLIPNIELTILDSQCCGIAGTYGFKKENYKTSQDIGEPLFKQIEALDIDYVVTDCETCKWQIEMSTSKRCEHPISILANALE